FQGSIGPSVARCKDRGPLSQTPGNTGSLSVNHSSRHRIVELRGLLLRMCQTLSCKIAQPDLEFSQPSPHPVFPFGGALLAIRLALSQRLQISWGSFLFCLCGLLLGTGFSLRDPVIHPSRSISLHEPGRLRGQEQQQSQTMLAWKFPARAGAVKRRPTE